MELIHNFFNYILDVQLTSRFALFCYWLPLLICTIGYFFDFVKEYQRDVAKADEPDFVPTITIGNILGRLFIAVCPLCNLWVALFRHSKLIVVRVYDFFAEAFNFPLVRQSAAGKAAKAAAIAEREAAYARRQNR